MLTAETPGSGEMYLKWLTYGLFSKDSTSSISCLDLNGSAFSHDDAAGIARVLGVRNPSKALLNTTAITVVAEEGIDDNYNQGRSGGDKIGHGNPRSQTQANNHIDDLDDGDDRDLGFDVLKAGTEVMPARLESNNRVFSAFVLKQDGRFRVMRNNERDKWVDIVVPCYGHCRVARASIDRLEHAAVSESSYSAGYNGSITSMAIANNRQASLFSLVWFVGSKLRELVAEQEIARDNVRQLLLSCPNLTYLGLERPDVGTSDLLLEAYASRQCKVESLEIDHVWSWNGANYCHTNFIRQLQDPASPIAKTLRRLTLFDGRSRIIDREVLDAFITMLDVNRRLEFVSLAAVAKHLNPRMTALMRTSSLWIPRFPLGLSQRCAFLSVVRHLSSTESTEPPCKRHRQEAAAAARAFDLRQLEPFVIALVFEFAVQGVNRVIDLEVDHFDHPPIGRRPCLPADQEEDPPQNAIALRQADVKCLAMNSGHEPHLLRVCFNCVNAASSSTSVCASPVTSQKASFLLATNPRSGRIAANQASLYTPTRSARLHMRAVVQ